MNKRTHIIKKIIFLILLLITFPTYSSLIRPGYFPMHDDMQAMRLLQMDKCVKDGQIPCRWVLDMGYGYGYPQFNYYAPLPYYIMDFFHLLGLGYLDSVKLGFISSNLVSIGGMFLLGTTLWGSLGGFVSSFLYAYAPYRALDFYVRGAMGELWALAFLPFVFWQALEVVKGKKRAILYFALFLAALFTSHNISALITIPFLILWVLIFLKKNDGKSPTVLKKSLFKIILGFIWGFGFASFFVIPAWFEKNLVHVETLITGYFNYINHFLGINQILFQTQWGYGTSEVGPWDDVLISVGIVQWILPLLVLFCLLILKRRKNILLILTLTIMGWFTLFISHPKSMFLWKSISILAFLQFPWRFLMLGTFFFSLACGSVVLLFNKLNKITLFWLIILLGIVIMLNKSYFIPRIWIDITDSEKFSGILWQNQQTISIFDYLPIYAQKPPAYRAPEMPISSDGNINVISGSKKSNSQTWEIKVNDKNATIQLPIFYFPNWQVKVDGVIIPIHYDNTLGIINFNLRPGTYNIRAKLNDTPVRTFSDFITILSLILIPIFLKKSKVKKI